MTFRCFFALLAPTSLAAQTPARDGAGVFVERHKGRLSSDDLRRAAHIGSSSEAHACTAWNQTWNLKPGCVKVEKLEKLMLCSREPLHA